MLPGYLDDAAAGFMLLRLDSGAPVIRDANRTAAGLVGIDRTRLVGTSLEAVAGLETVASCWTGPSADGDSPVVVRARVGPAADRLVQVTLTGLEDGGALVQLVDQTDEERLWAALDQERAITESTIERVTSTYARAVSQQLRTPLASVLGCAELLLEDQTAPLTDEQRTLAVSIERNSRRLRSLVLNLVDLASIDADGFVLARHDIDLQEVLRRAVDSVSGLVHCRHIELQVTAEPESFHVHGDARKLQAVVHSLLSSAVADCHLGGRIRVRLLREDDSVVLRIQDVGAGISRQPEPQAFLRAYRSTKHEPGANAGLGIGLPVAQAIVAAHGGSLDVTSTPGDGAQFSLRLQSAPSALSRIDAQEAS